MSVNNPLGPQKNNSNPAADKQDSIHTGDDTAVTNPTTQPRLTVVGIGASAGGLVALQTFFGALEDSTGMAFVVVTHMAPDQESLLPELLQRHTTMPVRQIEALIPVEPNHVYVIPPNRQIILTDTHLDIQEFEKPRGQRTPIDYFFRSLAKVHRDAIAIILSGGGTDGAVGVKTIKEQGGLLMVQHPEEAEYPSMPDAAINTGLADVVLPVAQLAQRLSAYQNNGVQLPRDAESLTDEQREVIYRILTQVQLHTGHDFSQYKRSTILRRIQRRMQLHGHATLNAYLEFLRYTAEESVSLFNDLLIGVTNFFRDRESWEALAEQIIPRLFTGKGPDDTIRVWAIGCSTGEEAYTMAMLLLEHAASLDLPSSNRPRLQIFASDLDDSALRKARAGLYPEAIEADVSPERLDRFFIKEGVYYRITREVSDMVLFSNHSVLRDPPFSRLDLISCRNLLIYLQRQLQQNVFQIFHYALKAEHYLFLGSSESAEMVDDMFHIMDKTHRIYQAKPWHGNYPPVPSLPLKHLRPAQIPRLPAVGEAHWPSSGVASGTAVFHLHLLEETAPPSVLINETHHILHLSQAAGRYLVHPGGMMTNELLKMIRPELRFELRNALFQAFEEEKCVVTHAVHVQFNGQLQRVVMAVRPHHAEKEKSEGAQRLALVFFLENEIGENIEAGSLTRDAEAGLDDARREALVAQLETEVQHLRERLQTTSEEYESSSEELKSTNEELQSINEEYRSATEELETSKEELQSVNEELQTVNAELKSKLEEISLAHNDLENLMASTDIATLFLDRNLRIQRFTPDMAELFNIMVGDRGRPINHLTNKLKYNTLAEDANEVLHNLVPIEREVEGETGRWWLARLRPYRTLDHRIEGVALTFVDITRRKQAADALRESKEQLADEVAALKRLHQMTSRVVTAPNLAEAMAEILNASVELLAADFGHLLLLDRQEQTLDIVAQIGFEQSFLDKFQRVDLDDNTTYGRAWRSGQRVIVEDVQADPTFVAHRSIAQEGGYTAVQSTPLISRNGTFLGILSTHSRQPCTLSPRDEQMLDLIARQAADLFERLYGEQVLEASVQMHTAQIRKLASQLTLAEHEERARIAQILHDDLQQQLYSLQLQLASLRNGAETEIFQHDVQRMQQVIETALKTTRQLNIDLSPPILEGEGLVEAVRWLLSQMKEQYGLEVVLETSDSLPPPNEDQLILLFQTIRELLFNAVKHAQVSTVNVKLEQQDKFYRIEVRDGGVGFDPKTVEGSETSTSRGLRYIRNRLQLIGGRLEIESAPGAGTQIVVMAPWSESSPSAAEE